MEKNNFNECIIKLLRQKPRLVDGVDNVCMASGHLWSLKRRKDYAKRFGRVPDWVMRHHIHLRNDLCRIALECDRPFWHLYQF